MTHSTLLPKWYAPTLVTLYVSSILLANITLNDFIPLPGYGLLSIGTIFFAAIFTLRDRIHQAGGLNLVYWAIVLALLVNTVAAVMMGTPIRFVAASFLAILCGELTDTAIYHRLRHRSWALRVLGSNAVSVPLDTLIFSFLAFYGSMSGGDILQIMYADIVAKYSISLLFMVRWHWVNRQKAAA